MQSSTGILVFTGAALAFAVAIPAAAVPTSRPELFTKLVNCRAIANPAERLACYDAQVGAIDAAEKSDDLVVMDRKQVRDVRRSLFGFTLPQFSFGGKKLNDGGADDITEIETTVQSVRRTGDAWSLILADDNGSWEASGNISSAPRVGEKVRIKKALMGSYLGSIGFTRGIRFKRVG